MALHATTCGGHSQLLLSLLPTILLHISLVWIHCIYFYFIKSIVLLHWAILLFPSEALFCLVPSRCYFIRGTFFLISIPSERLRHDSGSCYISDVAQ